MKVTPLEIRQQSFERVFRGYDKEAVDAYLASLSQEWERGQDELRTLRERNETLQEEIGRLKAIENTLYRTLQMAEETSNQMTQKASTDAEQHLRGARTEADETLNNARKQANMLVLDAENRTRYVVDEALEELRSLERDYKAIERYKDHLVGEIKRYSADALEKVSRFEEKVNKHTFEDKFGELKSLNLPGQPAGFSEPESAVETPETADSEPVAETPVPDVQTETDTEAESETTPQSRSGSHEATDSVPPIGGRMHAMPVGTAAETSAPTGSFFDAIQ